MQASDAILRRKSRQESTISASEDKEHSQRPRDEERHGDREKWLPCACVLRPPWTRHGAPAGNSTGVSPCVLSAAVCAVDSSSTSKHPLMMGNIWRRIGASAAVRESHSRRPRSNYKRQRSAGTRSHSHSARSSSEARACSQAKKREDAALRIAHCAFYEAPALSCTFSAFSSKTLTRS